MHNDFLGFKNAFASVIRGGSESDEHRIIVRWAEYPGNRCRGDPMRYAKCRRSCSLGRDGGLK